MKKTNTSTRLKQIMKDRQLKQVDILRLVEPYAKQYGISLGKSALSQYITGKVEPGQYKLMLLGKALNVSETWLMGYDVPMERNISSNTPLPSKDESIQLQGREAAHLRIYRKLNESGKDAADDYIIMLAETPKYTDTPLDKVQTSIIYFDTPVSAGTGQYLDNDSYIMLDLMEKPPKGAEFVVRVCGDSMEPTYKDGDKLYIEPMQQIEKGDIGIFSINGDVFVKECGDGVLISHNPKYKPIPLDESDNLHCFGKVIGTCKKYR